VESSGSKAHFHIFSPDMCPRFSSRIFLPPPETSPRHYERQPACPPVFSPQEWVAIPPRKKRFPVKKFAGLAVTLSRPTRILLQGLPLDGYFTVIDLTVIGILPPGLDVSFAANTLSRAVLFDEKCVFPLFAFSSLLRFREHPPSSRAFLSPL